MLDSLLIAFATYSKIPVPKAEWNDRTMKYSMCFFPMVGMMLGVCCYGIFTLMDFLKMGVVLKAAVLTILPVLFNGGIHMDGFLDTMDAKHSYQSRERKLEILKDPHTGAFAIICGIVYMIAMFGLCSEVTKTEIIWMSLGYIFSRILSAFSVVTLKKAKKDGMLAYTADRSKENVKWILLVQLITFLIAILFLDPFKGIFFGMTGLMMFAYYRHMSYKIFGGVTGDLAGYFLQMCECMLLVTVVILKYI